MAWKFLKPKSVTFVRPTNIFLNPSSSGNTRQNVAVLDQSTLTTTQVGVQRSQGMETTLVGRITDRWSVLGNYAHVDSRITEDDIPSRVGKPFRNVPCNTASL